MSGEGVSEEERKKREEEVMRYIEEIMAKEREKPIHGLGILPGDCLRIVISRWVYTGKVVSITYNIVVLEDIFGKTHSVNLSRAWAISEIDCKDLEFIKEQVERRMRRKREKTREEETKA